MYGCTGMGASLTLFFTTGKFMRYCSCCNRRRRGGNQQGGGGGEGGDGGEMQWLRDGTRSEPPQQTSRSESFIEAMQNQPEFVRRPSLLLRANDLPK